LPVSDQTNSKGPEGTTSVGWGGKIPVKAESPSFKTETSRESPFKRHFFSGTPDGWDPISAAAEDFVFWRETFMARESRAFQSKEKFSDRDPVNAILIL